MASSIVAAAGRLKAQVAHFLSVGVIAQVAATLGLEWNHTTLALPQLVALFARQILWGNISMPELARRAGAQFTPEAFCIARARLPLELLQELPRRVCLLAPRHDQDPAGLWKGHRLWHIDGSSFSMPDTPALRKRFGQPQPQKQGCGFPVAHLLCLFDAATGLVRQVIVAPLFTHDLAHAPQLHAYISAGDVLLGDRAFESFAHLALLVSRGVQAILPAHQKRKVDFKRQTRRGRKGRLERQRLARLGPCDQIVRWRKPSHKPARMSRQNHRSDPLLLCAGLGENRIRVYHEFLQPGRVSFADALYWMRHGDLTLPLPRLEPLSPGVAARHFDLDHSLGLLQDHRLHRPRRNKSQNLLVEFGVIHARSLHGSIRNPTGKPEGPKSEGIHNGNERRAGSGQYARTLSGM